MASQHERDIIGKEREREPEPEGVRNAHQRLTNENNEEWGERYYPRDSIDDPAANIEESKQQACTLKLKRDLKRVLLLQGVDVRANFFVCFQ